MTLGVRTAEDEALDALALGAHEDPFAVLGRHETTERGRPALIFRTIQPSADSVELVTPEGSFVMERRRPAGVFEATIPLDAIPLDGAQPEEFAYRYRVHEGGRTRDVIDPYQFGQVLTDFDLHLVAEGTHYRAWEKLGAHRLEIDGVTGVHFAVWAPNAQRVSVIGDFNGWDGRVHAMRLLVPAGVWEIFIPDLPDGQKYKYEIRTRTGAILKKTDPYAVAFEVPPQSASVVRDISRPLSGS